MKRRRRYTTATEDAAYLAERFADLHRDWKVGDVTLPYKGTTPTTIVRFEGDVVHLANGTSMHRSHLRRVPQED